MKKNRETSRDAGWDAEKPIRRLTDAEVAHICADVPACFASNLKTFFRFVRIECGEDHVRREANYYVGEYPWPLAVQSVFWLGVERMFSEPPAPAPRDGVQLSMLSE